MMYSIPAVITAYDREQQRATVQPTLIPKMVDGVHVPYPPIEDVPVEMPCTANCAILLPVKVGDSVVLDIMDHSIDEWARYENSMTMVETDSLRKNQLSDAVARVGLRTFNDCYGTTDDLVILMKIGVPAQEEPEDEEEDEEEEETSLEEDVITTVVTGGAGGGDLAQDIAEDVAEDAEDELQDLESELGLDTTTDIIMQESRITMTASGAIKLETPTISFLLNETGNVTVTATSMDLEASSINMKTSVLDVTGAIHATDVISSDADVLAGSKSLLTHD